NDERICAERAVLKLAEGCDTAKGLAQEYAGVWRLDGNGNDATGTNDGALLPVGTPPSAIIDRYGNSNTALNFSGANYAYVAGSNLLNNNAGTVCVWLKADVLDANSRYVVSSSDEASTVRFIGLLRIGPTPNPVATIYQYNNDVPDLVTGSTVLATGRWYHICTMSNGSTYKIYVNGTQETLSISGGANNGDWLSDTTARDNFAIGAVRRSSGVSNYFDGTIDEVRIWDRALSPEEIKKIYDESKP
ncbi:MAG: LamG domain-containing protein, partial [Nanoarchaeota archaeon]